MKKAATQWGALLLLACFASLALLAQSIESTETISAGFSLAFPEAPFPKI
ncbi:MAG: hypothetical protein AAGI92_02220 [Pseudomonadota bacterium]